mgnify:FL=1
MEKELSSLIAKSFYAVKHKKQAIFWTILIVTILVTFAWIGSLSHDDSSIAFWLFLLCAGFIIMTCIITLFASDDIYVERHVIYTRSIAYKMSNKKIVRLCNTVLNVLAEARKSAPMHPVKPINWNMDRSISDFAYQHKKLHTQ